MTENGGITIKLEAFLKASQKDRDIMMYDMLQQIACRPIECDKKFKRLWKAIIILFVISFVGISAPPWWFKLAFGL